jgi:hypothetical protein
MLGLVQVAFTAELRFTLNTGVVGPQKTWDEALNEKRKSEMKINKGNNKPLKEKRSVRSAHALPADLFPDPVTVRAIAC